MSNSLELVKSTIQRLLQEPWLFTIDSIPGNSYLYMLIFSQLQRSHWLLNDLPKEPILDWHGLIYEELHRVVNRIGTLVGHSGDISIPAEARGEHFLETLLDLRWWTWVTALQAGMLLGNPILYNVCFRAFEGVLEANFSTLTLSGDSIPRRLPTYSFELWQQDTEDRMKEILQFKSECNKMLDEGKNEADILLTGIRNAEMPVFEIKQMRSTIFLDAGKPSSIQDYLEIDLTQDLLGASSTGYVIRTTFSDGKRGAYSCALKRINSMNDKPPDLARLWHPHVVHLKHYWIEGGGGHDGVTRGSIPNSNFMTFLVMELMHGDLAKLLTRTKKAGVALFSLPVAVDVMLQIAKGMLYLHEMGVSHPHLKSENVLCRIKKKTETCRVGDVLVKLGGFGCSRPANVDTKNRDVLCFGLTCLEILTGDECSTIPETTPPILKRCIASCLNTELTFSEVVMLLLLAQLQILQTCKDGVMSSSESLHKENAESKNKDLASSSRSDDDLQEMFHVHQLHPQLGEVPASAQITLIFFHGFPKVSEEWRMTWMTRDNKLLWPQKWLPKNLDGDIRVLAVSFIERPNVSSNLIQVEICKHLLQRLVLSSTWKLDETEQAIVLVGHSFGGVIIKFLVTEAQSLARKAVQNSTDFQEVMQCKKFLKSLSSIVFYSVPHSLTDTEFKNFISGCSNTRVLQRSSFLKSLREDDCFIRDMIQLSEDFESVVPHKTKVLAFLEGKPMSKKCCLVTEKSCEGPSLNWEWYKVDEDNHFEVCRPNSESHTGYTKLLQHLKQHVASPHAFSFPYVINARRLSWKLIGTVFVAICKFKKSLDKRRKGVRDKTRIGQRFKLISHRSSSQSLDLDPLLNCNLDGYPHLKELLRSYKSEWVKDESKYGCYDAVPLPVFQSQIFEDLDTDFETAFATRGGDVDEEELSTLEWFASRTDPDAVAAKKHCGRPPLPCDYPFFYWHSERAAVFGQRTRKFPPSSSTSEFKISVRVVSLTMQAGLVEPVYGTMCLYNKEKREKLSEDFHFQFLPPEFRDDYGGGQRSVLFSLEAGSSAICLLIQFEKHVTERGVRLPVYTRKDPSIMSDREKRNLQYWVQKMPFREPFAWATVPLFDSNVTGGVGGFTVPSSSLPPSLSLGSANSKHHNTGQHEAVIVDVPALISVKENYMEETLMDSKRLAHKPVRGTLRLEVEKVSQQAEIEQYEMEPAEIEQDGIEQSSTSECGSSSSSSIDGDGSETSSSSRHLPQGSSDYTESSSRWSSRWSSKFQSPRLSSMLESSRLSSRLSSRWSSMDKRQFAHSPSASRFEFPSSPFKAVEFQTSNNGEPMSQMLHCLYIYPKYLNLSKKLNIFIQVELRHGDNDIRQPPLEALYARVADSNMQEYGHSQVDINTKVPHYHDEFKIRLPAVITQQHHLLFTFFHVNLLMKSEAPEPVVVGYSVLPLLIGAQVLRYDGTLPVVKELLPYYLEEPIKEQMELLDEGKAVFRLRSRLCSSFYPVDEKLREFFAEYDKLCLRSFRINCFEAFNALNHIELSAILQFLHPTLNMLLRIIVEGVETLQVLAFRSMVNIVSKLQHQTQDVGGDRNEYLVQYVDYSFDDLGGLSEPVYPQLLILWRSLARSKAKGYKVDPVYDDILSISWVFLELIVKSMALEQSRNFSGSLPPGENLPPLQLNDDVYKSVAQLFDAMLTEVYERCKSDPILTKRLNSSMAFFCFDLLSVIISRQVFEMVALYIDKFTGVHQSIMHECKLDFLRVILSHDLFVEIDISQRNHLASVLMQELLNALHHGDAALKNEAARTLVVQMCKHDYDARYQTLDDKLYISQIYFPFINLILEDMPVFYALNPSEKRDILVCVLHHLHHLDDGTLIKAWQQSAAHTKLFFKLLEECQDLFEYTKAKPSDGLMGAMPLSEQGDGVIRYTEKLSPSVNMYLAEVSSQRSISQATPGAASFFWKRVSPQLNSPTQVHRDILARGLDQTPGNSSTQVRASLNPMLRRKLELWEENLSASVALLILEIVEKFMDAAAALHAELTNYVKLDCITTIFIGFLSRSQPLSFWKAFLPVFDKLCRSHGSILMTGENGRFLKQITFHLLRLALFRNEFIRKMAVVGLQILVRTSFCSFRRISRLKVMLTISLSELLSDVQVIHTRMDGSLEKSGEAQRLQNSLKQMAMSSYSKVLLRDNGLSEDTLEAKVDNEGEDLWRWSEISDLSETLSQALDLTVEHALMEPYLLDKYYTSERYLALALAYRNVPDLHIMWFLYLCEFHQKYHSYAEAAQCAVAVAGVIMQAIVVGGKDKVWSKDDVDVVCKICPMVRDSVFEEAAKTVEGYGTSKLRVKSAVEYLQLANKLFFQADLFHFCEDIVRLIIPVHKARSSYEQLSKCYSSLCSIYEAVQEQETSPVPFKDAMYYRVGFYGLLFGKMDHKEYVYKEAHDIRLEDVIRNLGNIYESKVVEGGQTLHILCDSRQLNVQDLLPGMCYLQITSLDPIFQDEDLDSLKEGKPANRTSRVIIRVSDRFMFDTPFTKDGSAQGRLEAQWKRRTILQTEGSFPTVVNRLLVIKSDSREFSPIENTIGMIEAGTKALSGALEEHDSMVGDQALQLRRFQHILAGSVAVQDDSGVLGVCTAFLSGERTKPALSQELQQLLSALLEFMGICKKAIRRHARLIGEEDQDFHSQLVISFQRLVAKLSDYIPAISTEL